jgi:hypothetical protein
MITRIKSIERTDNPMWTWNNKSFYDFWVECEDGTAGTASSTSPEAPPYSVGDEVEVETSSNKWGVKLKISKVKAPNAGGNKEAYWAEKDERISRQWAINAAMEYIIHASTDRKHFNDDEIKMIARNLLHMRDTLFEDKPKEKMPF